MTVSSQSLDSVVCTTVHSKEIQELVIKVQQNFVAYSFFTSCFLLFTGTMMTVTPIIRTRDGMAARIYIYISGKDIALLSIYVHT